MDKLLLLGDEAIAQAALDAGLSGVYAYPGTPSTEITEYIQNTQKDKTENIHCRWSTNEKTAMEAALGMSFAGKRALVCMKCVGVNVCADPFINSAITGIVGGLVFVAADDPSMHSSQDEQDSRFYGNFAMVPILEPSSQQEAYDMVYNGFELSERCGVPVMLRIVTRLAHSRAGVVRRERKPQNELHYSKDPKQFMLLPAVARLKYKKLLESQKDYLEYAEESAYNHYTDGPDKSKGVVASGIAFNYLMENYPEGCPFPVLKIGQYPLPETKLRKMVTECKELVVVEEGYPFIEDQLKGLLGIGLTVHGKKDGWLPRAGELNPDIVGKAFGFELPETPALPEVVKNRPPSLCVGCGHRDMYDALNAAVHEKGEDSKVFGDIGCYTLGYLPPYKAIHSCVDMGASITMAKGASDAGLKYAVAVIGDSTFTHSGMTSLLDAVNENAPITVIISDNETTAMTGGQDSAGTGKIEAICLGLGVNPEHLKVLVPLKKNHDEMVETIRLEMNYRGLSVIIPRRECIQTASRKNKNK
ncbi:MAG: indolepyruvate ferredoxin oxidoreductase subunit alpha [Bacteroidales bacterium]|nr:indolepyruvate ferredoxin oxidoreductase subunit alpha [Bacteroidales bacterium]MDD3906971.1 indolepyruvate ferredoxin oxidoreductase subunit alpha [Bacteroidales bacterium]MDD4712767.1 indolepyruvate ferredoxin oxidoreductase subunit alpha [Bacteroidales bacterium]